jgi:hypothetical protein
VIDSTRLDALALPDRTLSPDECAEAAGAAAAFVDLATLERQGEGYYELLWRTPTSEAWLNVWLEPRDTGFHDHGGSCVGVYVLAGRARHEALVVRGPRRVTECGEGDAFSCPEDGIHRMEHDRGAVTIHVYSPPLGAIGHYEIVDGALHRHAGPPDEISPPSPTLSAVLADER